MSGVTTVDKEKKIKVVLGVLMVIAVLVWARGCEKPPVGAAGAQLNQSEIASLLAMTSGSVVVARSVYPAWGRNPFVLEAGKSAKKLTLNGILWDDQSPKALIGDHIVGKGDSIGQSVVVDIYRDRVILNNGMEYLELRLGE